jgi:hypothetical protein
LLYKLTEVKIVPSKFSSRVGSYDCFQRVSAKLSKYPYVTSHDLFTLFVAKPNISLDSFNFPEAILSWGFWNKTIIFEKFFAQLV